MSDETPNSGSQPFPLKGYWKYRRTVAFLSLFQLFFRTWLASPEDFEVYAYVLLVAQWAIPAVIEDCFKIMGNKLK